MGGVWRSPRKRYDGELVVKTHGKGRKNDDGVVKIYGWGRKR